MAKRSLDLALAGLALLLVAPVCLLCAILIKLDGPGSVLFRQERIGRFGRPFQILKFRTMAELPQPGALQITAVNDPRITRVGRWLRRSKLDELPQLINVLVGDMSLVGPRPEVPRYVRLYPQAVRDLVFSVRPGLTDEASIRFRHEEELLAAADDPDEYYVNQILPRKLASYVEYVRTRSLLSDIGILVRTVGAVIRGST